MNLINDDCMNILPKYADDYFDLAIVDPPYGLGDKLKQGGNTGVVTFKDLYNGFDDAIPDKEYFDELFRVSKNQIIWGGNYFLDYLGNTRGIICWDKNLGHPRNFSHFELAWTSFDCIARKISYSSNSGDRIHPTQKPIKLYRWLLENYAKPTDKILDTHLGSGSSAIACHYFGTEEFVGIEIDKKYYDMANKRIEKETRQIKLL